MGWRDTLEKAPATSWRDTLEKAPATIEKAPDEDNEGGVFVPKHLQPEDITRIAGKHQVDPEWLRDVTELYTGRFVEEDTGPLGAASEIGSAILGKLGGVALRLPQLAYKKSLDDPKKRAALDELQDLAYEKQSSVFALTEALAGPSAAAKVLKKLGEKALTTGAKQLGAHTALGAAEGAVAGAGWSKEGQEVHDMLWGAGYGALFGAAMGGWEARKIAKALEPRQADVLGELAEAIGTENKRYNDELADVLLDFDTPAGSLVQSRRRELASELAGKRVKNPDPVIKKALQREGPEHVRKINDFINSRNDMLEAVRRENYVSAPGLFSGVTRLVNGLSDARYAFKDIELRNSGAVNLLPALDDATVAFNKYTAGAKVLRNNYQDLATETRKLTPEARIKLFDELDTQLEPTSKLGKAWRETYENLRTQANKAGLPVPKLTDDVGNIMPYVPAKMQALPDALVAIRSRANKLGLPTNGRVNKEVFESMDPDILESLSYITGRTLANTETEFARQWKNAFTINNKNIGRLVGRAQASLERGDEIPALIRNKDVVDLADSWVQNTLRHIHLRDDVAKIRSQIPVLEKLGDTHGANYLNNWIKSVNGEMSGLSGLQRAAGTGWEYKMKALADSATDPVSKNTLEFAARIPNLMGQSISLIYANVLGTNPKAMVRNLTQPFVLSAPELGGIYGQKIALEALGSVRKFKTGAEELKKYGLIPEVRINEARDALSDGLVAARVTITEKLSNFMMSAYQATDTINRIVTLDMAKRVSQDLLKSTPPPGSLDYVRRLAPGYRRAVQRAIVEGDPENLVKIVSKQLLSETQFNYNRLNMSEFGRTAGPLFSMFTKWPTAVIGDLHTKSRHGQLGKAATKYLGPLAAFGVLDAMADPEIYEQLPRKFRGKDLTGDRWNLFVGSGGFSKWAPVYSVSSVLEAAGTGGGILRPPVVQTVQDLFKKDRTEWFDQVVKTYTPGAGIAKALLIDVPTAVSGKKPEGMFWRTGSQDLLDRPISRFGTRRTGIGFYGDLLDE